MQQFSCQLRYGASMMGYAIERLTKLAPVIREHEISRLDAVLESCKTEEDTNKLILHHSISQADAARACGLSLNTFKERVNEALEQGVIPEVLFENNKYRYTLNHIHALLDWMKVPKWADKNKGCVVLNVQNQKGGTGKSSSVISLATAIALRLNERRRVLVIDLDPQGSLRAVAAPNLSAAGGVLSAVDIMLGEEEEGSEYQGYISQGYDHEAILKGSILSTHIPNLDILPAFPTDERFSSIAWLSYAKNNVLKHLSYFKEKVVDHLLEDYDMIIVDTGPHVNPLTWSSLEACNSLLIPVSPRKLDWSSTGQFLCNLPEQLNYLPRKGENIKYFKVLAVNYDEEQNRDLEMLNQIKDVLGKDMLNSTIKRSSAFEAGSRNYRTVFDIKKGDNLCPDRQLDKALSSLQDVSRELLLSLNEIDFGAE